MLNVLATRLGRISDWMDGVARSGVEPGHDTYQRQLRWRTRALDAAVVLAALAGALTCGTVLVIFLGAVSSASFANLLFLLFAGAIVLTLCAIIAFVAEMLVAARGVRQMVDRVEGRSTDSRTS